MFRSSNKCFGLAFLSFPCAVALRGHNWDEAITKTKQLTHRIGDDSVTESVTYVGDEVARERV